MKVMYTFQSAVGLFWIKPQNDGSKLWRLGLDDEWLGSYPTPIAAAKDVFAHQSGWDAWDQRQWEEGDPVDINTWTQIGELKPNNDNKPAVAGR
jgi:hypothetical protein